MAAAGLLGGGDADPAPGPPGPTGTAGPEAGTTATAPASDAGAPGGGPRLGWEPTAAEQELGRMIPAVFRPDCGPVAPLTAPTVAAVVRRPTHGRMEYRVEYHRFESAARLNAFMAGREKLGDETSDCGKTASGSSTYTAQGETAGKLVCYLREGQAWIEWSNVGARVYASARRTDGNWRALFNFWTGAGPLVPAP